MIAEITFAVLTAHASPSPTLRSLRTAVVQGPRPPIGRLVVPHDFVRMSAIASFDFGRISLRDALASMAPPQTVSAPIGISVRVIQPQAACNAKPTMWFAIGAQIADAIVTANARIAGSLPSTSFASSRSLSGNLLQYGLGDFITFSLTRHAPCAARNFGAFALGASAINNAVQTGWPK